MAVPTDTELGEIVSAIARLESIAAANHAALTQRIEVGFAELRGEMKTQFAELSAKVDRVEGKLDTKVAELGGKIDVLNERTSIGFWSFVGRALIVTVFGFLVLVAVKYSLTGKPML